MIFSTSFILLVIISTIATVRTECQEVRLFSGKVIDAATSLPLPSATIRIAGSSKGTITNQSGEFRISLPESSYTAIVSYIGYRSDSIAVTLHHLLSRTIPLQPSPVQLTGLIITDEDPAYEIIRQAIDRKKHWMNAMRTFEGKAFTRLVMKKDTAIAMITESYSTLFWNQDDSLREIITQTRKTGNLPPTFQPPRVGTVVNFNDDEIHQGGFTFIGPTAPNAFEYYEYKLLCTTRQDDYDVYQISIIPKSRIVPLFNGTISIAERSYAVIEVDLAPNEAFSMPFFRLKDTHYKQIFKYFHNEFWLPVNYQYRSSIIFSLLGLSLHLALERDVVIYDYAINSTFPDSIRSLPVISYDSSSTKFDSVFWSKTDVLPLTLDQQDAYVKLDSTQSLDKQFQPKGSTAVLLNIMNGGLSNIDFYFNRVEGFHLGLKGELRDLVPHIDLHGGLGYGMSDRTWKYDAGVQWNSVRDTVSISNNFSVSSTGMKQWKIEAEAYRKHITIPLSRIYNNIGTTLYILVEKREYHDYYLVEGFSLGSTYRYSSDLTGSLTFINEGHRSSVNTTDFALLSRSKTYRINPPIAEGYLQALQFNADYGNPFAFTFMPNALQLSSSIEYTSRSFFNSNFSFTRYFLHGRSKLSTMGGTTLLFPPTLEISLLAGTTEGKIPPQRYFDIDAPLSGFATSMMLRGSTRKELSGDQLFLATVEHNFRRIPFLLLGFSPLAETNLELILRGSVAQTWVTSHSAIIPGFPISTFRGWYYEGGLGINNILDVFRIDVTWRGVEPKGFHFTLSAANFLEGIAEGL